MASDTRIYRVDEKADGKVAASFLVRASSAAQAVRHVAKRFDCEVASQDDLVELAGAGVKVETAANGSTDVGSD